MKLATRNINALAVGRDPVGKPPLPDRPEAVESACSPVAQAGWRATRLSAAGTFIRPWVWLLLALGHGLCAAQDLHYVEPGAASCPRVPESPAARAQHVVLGTPVRGRIHVHCGFADGSYTVTLSATDAGAVFAPRSFLVNFGQIVGDGAYVVTFATIGLHRVTASVTSNMGSPAVQGEFVGPHNAFNVVQR